MEKRKKEIPIDKQKESVYNKVYQINRSIRFGKQRPSFKDCSFEATFPNDWIIDNYSEEASKYNASKLDQEAREEWEKAKKASFYVCFTRQANFLSVSAPTKEICLSPSVPNQEIEEVKNSLIGVFDENKKMELFYNWLIAKFVAGYDTVSFESLGFNEAFLNKCTDPFTRKGFASPLKNGVTDGLDFVNATNSRKSIKELFDIIRLTIEQIDCKVRKCLSIYCKSSDIGPVKEYYENDLKEYDKQVELAMWAVIRKGCRQLCFYEPKEMLCTMFFTPYLQRMRNCLNVTKTITWI